ncbi:interferon-inducible GTPase-domain-containing protein [Rhodofomes roseus]|uniref:Interferon-inducible GTPase-domain-containing protein n=1 Tax=Rhodofomes roseus TaxID=34475 RepID=A0ABQ8K6J6_9APHY|nr:interferon-inducible GTPase-domain-containing protein [Rhodofomes roseus]KAH9832856.1 interferon-inducible GTPase-domain-containing protein [Rhodofomes roseus]
MAFLLPIAAGAAILTAETARRINEARGRTSTAPPTSAQAETRRTAPAGGKPPDARREGGSPSRGGGEGKRVEEDLRKAAEAAAERAEQERRKAVEQRAQAEEAAERDRQERMGAVEEMLRMSVKHQEAEWARQAAENAVAEARAAREMAEMKLREGIRPVLLPTLEEFDAAKKRMQYQENLFHFAVVGSAGSGKSSLVNALRGVRNGKAGSAPTGTSETTMETARYPDSNSSSPFVWYDVPGAGTQSMPDWKYFIEQGLYIFDAIIVVYGDRFTEIDIAILRNCARWQIPTYIVRSKAIMHIQNSINDLLGSDDEDEEDVPTSLFDRGRGPAFSARHAEARDRARGKYIKETRRDVATNLARAELQDQRVYIVDNVVLVPIVRGKEHPDIIDEVQLYRDLLTEAKCRRIAEND